MLGACMSVRDVPALCVLYVGNNPSGAVKGGLYFAFRVCFHLSWLR